MAYIRKLSSGRYQVAWRENVRDEFGAPIPNQFVARSETVDDEKTANRRKMVIEAKIEAGIHPSAQRDKAATPLAEYARRYFEAAAPTMTERTLNGYIALYRVHIVDVFGSRPIGSILPSDVARWYSTLLAATPHRRKNTRNPKTAKQALGVLRRICNLGVLDSAISSNPAAIKLTSTHKHRSTASAEAAPQRFRHLPLTPAQIGQLAEYVENTQHSKVYALALTFCAYTGLRAAELAGLEIGDLTLSDIGGTAGAVRVERTKTKRERRWEIDSPKTKESVRTNSFGKLACRRSAELPRQHAP